MNEKILIVDDEKLIRWSLSEAVRSWGYLPIEAIDVKTAIETFRLENPVITYLILVCRMDRDLMFYGKSNKSKAKQSL